MYQHVFVFQLSNVWDWQIRVWGWVIFLVYYSILMSLTSFWWEIYICFPFLFVSFKISCTMVSFSTWYFIYIYFINPASFLWKFISYDLFEYFSFTIIYMLSFWNSYLNLTFSYSCYCSLISHILHFFVFFLHIFNNFLRCIS